MRKMLLVPGVGEQDDGFCGVSQCTNLAVCRLVSSEEEDISTSVVCNWHAVLYVAAWLEEPRLIEEGFD